jgi:hypothetical protein
MPNHCLVVASRWPIDALVIVKNMHCLGWVKEAQYTSIIISLLYENVTIKVVKLFFCNLCTIDCIVKMFVNECKKLYIYCFKWNLKI